MTEGSSPRVRTEAIALALLAVLPTVPHLSFIAGAGVPRFMLFGDFALLEHATRHVWSGDTLLGPYSRYFWHHPGPLLFYLLAPFEALYGKASTGLYVGTCCINAAAAATMVGSTRLLASRAHAVAVLAIVLAWCCAFGNVVANPWNPLVVVLPLMSYLVAVAALARGKSVAVYPAVVFGTLAAQTHVATLTTVAATGLVALIVCVRRGFVKRDRRRFVRAGVALFLLFLPPLLQTVKAPGMGNFRRLGSHLIEPPDPLVPASAAARDWATSTSWMGDRVVHRTLAGENVIPLGMRWDPMPAVASRGAIAIAIAHLVLIVLAAVVARRRRDDASWWLLAMGLIANGVAMMSLRAIAGVDYYYLVFWTTAVSCVAWMGILSSAFSALYDFITPRVSPQNLVRLAIAVALTFIVGATWAASLQREWLSNNPVAPAARPELQAPMRSLYGALRARLSRDGVTPVLHREGSNYFAYAVLLELEKDDVGARVMKDDEWMFFGVPTASKLDKPVHIYFSTMLSPLPQAPCLELLAQENDIAMYAAPIDTPACN